MTLGHRTEDNIENRMVTEKEKMLSGEMYDATDPQLIDERRRARVLCKSLNESHDSEQKIWGQGLISDYRLKYGVRA